MMVSTVRLDLATPRTQRGFTLIELMVVVAVIAILAIVVIPQFFGSARKVKSDTEVSSMFTEIMTREEQYKVEKGAYIDVAECPTTTTPAGVATSTCTANADWLLLRLNPNEQTLRCKYEVTSGVGTGTNNPVVGFTWASPPGSWYYMLATCNTDGNVGVETTFFTASSDTKIQKLNEGN